MSSPSTQSKHNSAALLIGALGIVYGDIGTSPLYAFRECLSERHQASLSHEGVLGLLSLIAWALVLVITVKYIIFVMRADNRGEGGILALMALSLPKGNGTPSRRRYIALALGVFGAALLYGDGMITPAISVLSAVEGLEIATPVFKSTVIPLTILILTALFLFQKHGTGRLGAVFGPIMLVWFASLALLGAAAIARQPGVLAALNPWHAIRFMVENGWTGFKVLGAVFLAVTGGEALYADMGHFGPTPIRRGWVWIVFPSLLINYFGQGALVLTDPATAANPFYALAPRWALLPMVVLATLATIIASQAIISGAFSLTRQAILLGYLPRLSIRHTSSEEIGQIFVPAVNRLLLVCAVGLVLVFESSGRMAAAYGVAVSSTMLITTVLFLLVARRVWKWRLAALVPLAVSFLIFDTVFFGASMMKLLHGGWFPLLVGVLIYVVMATWRRGRQLLGAHMSTRVLSIENFLESLKHASPPPLRVSGTGIFFSGNPGGVPPVLLHNVRYNRILHETTVLLTIRIDEVSHVSPEDRVELKDLGNGFYQVIARYGFMESPDVAGVLRHCANLGLKFDPRLTAYFLGRETIVRAKRPSMARWRIALFSFLSRNAQGFTGFFRLPPSQVIELGIQVEL